jgi:hypothetical protein
LVDLGVLASANDAVMGSFIGMGLFMFGEFSAGEGAATRSVLGRRTIPRQGFRMV